MLLFFNEFTGNFNTVGTCESNSSYSFIPIVLKIVSEYDNEIPQSQTADKPMAPRGRATQ